MNFVERMHGFSIHSYTVGNVNSVDCNDEMERWSGALDWTARTGILCFFFCYLQAVALTSLTLFDP